MEGEEGAAVFRFLTFLSVLERRQGLHSPEVKRSKKIFNYLYIFF